MRLNRRQPALRAVGLGVHAELMQSAASFATSSTVSFGWFSGRLRFALATSRSSFPRVKSGFLASSTRFLLADLFV
jgi:hypothetical protein